MKGYMELKSLTMDELTGVVNLYPWFGGARKELFMRLLAHGDDAASGTAFSDAAMYVSSRRLLSKAFRDGRRQTCEDDDIGNLLKRYIAAAPETDSSKVAPAADGNAYGEDKGRKVYVVGGDYFSQDQYDEVRKSEAGVFSDFAARSKAGMSAEELEEHESMDIYTETLAQIYADQGYYEQAKNIYSKLILAYPEKNAYFAALIQKLEHGNQN